MCPQCHHSDSKVLETRSSGASIRRRRSCLHCTFRFTTQERIERKNPLVIKRDGSREPFDREKILRGLQVACRKRTITAQQLEEATDRLELRVLSRVGGEILASDIGRLVLDELRDLDLVGYLRFASVYQEVQSASDFIKLLSPWVETSAEE
ncbi:MAG: transcriptional repressor NrdR [Myxococcota bacterium]|jgi:transcriptional repressor NrdR